MDGTVSAAQSRSIPSRPAISADVPLLIGNMRDEAIFFERDNPAFFHMDEAAVTALARQHLGDAADRILAVYRQAMAERDAGRNAPSPSRRRCSSATTP